MLWQIIVAGAQAALNMLANPGRLLSVTQVGVTLASLGLGWAGEDTLYRLILTNITPLKSHVSEVVLHGISFAAAFLLISYAHVIIGEVVPKNLAIEKAARVAVLTAPPLLFFYRVVSSLRHCSGTLGGVAASRPRPSQAERAAGRPLTRRTEIRDSVERTRRPPEAVRAGGHSKGD